MKVSSSTTIAILGLIISTISIWFAYRADMNARNSIAKADVANAIASDAKDISSKALDFNQKDRLLL